MTCRSCGYVLDALDAECPRCKRMSAYQPPPAELKRPTCELQQPRYSAALDQLNEKPRGSWFSRQDPAVKWSIAIGTLLFLAPLIVCLGCALIPALVSFLGGATSP